MSYFSQPVRRGLLVAAGALLAGAFSLHADEATELKSLKLQVDDLQQKVARLEPAAKP